MTGLPHAIIENPRPPRRVSPAHARAIRRAIAVAVIATVCAASWRLLKVWTRSESNKQLELRQRMARDRIGDGLDPLFEHQLEVDSMTVGFTASFDIAPELGSGYDQHSCAKGFQQAFDEALESNVVVFEAVPRADSRYRVLVTGAVKPSGQSFQLAYSSTSYRGLALAADIELLGKTVHADVRPGSQLEIEYTRSRWDTGRLSETEVASGIMQGTCKQAA